MMQKLRKWLNLTPDNIQAYNPLHEENNHSKELKLLSHNSSAPVKDTDLEFLFHQLLEGVVNGWQENRIEQFFEKLEPKITIEVWLDWLQRYRTKLMASPAPQNKFAARMVVLGEITASLPFVRPVGDLAYEIGKQLLNRANNPLVESLKSNIDIESLADDEDEENTASEDDLSSLGDMLSKLQKDPDFAENTARHLGLNTSDPGMIIEKIVQDSELPSEASPVMEENEIVSPSPSPETQESSSPETIDQLFHLGLEKAQKGELEQAIAYWDQALAFDNNLIHLWHNRGSALAYLHRFEEAIKSFDNAIAIDINHYQSWNDRGNALYSLKRWQEAIISWDRVLVMHPKEKETWYHRGLALEKLQLYSEAINSYKKSLEIDPNFTRSQNRLTSLAKLNHES